jgi:uncharacterized protein involved in exopolysaccharide biosynthesis
MQEQQENKIGDPLNLDSIKSTSDISLTDLKNELGKWKNIIRNNYIKLLIAGILGFTIGFIYAFIDKPVFTAKTRFMLKNEGVGSLFGGQMTGLTSLLGGGQMGTPLERTSEVIASDRIVGRALLREMIVGDSTDIVINHFIRLSGLLKKWEKDTLLSNVKFSKTDYSIEKLNLSQRMAYKYVKNQMTPEKGEGVVRKSFDKKSGVLTLSCVHEHQDFAISLSKIIYSELSDFFIEQMTYSALNNAEVMHVKLDSIKRELDIVRRLYASQSDQSLGLLLQQDKVDLKSLAVKEQILNVMYAEAIKNYESFEFINKAATPSLMLIDSPIAPIKATQKSKILYSLIGFVFSSLSLFMIFILINKIKST